LHTTPSRSQTPAERTRRSTLPHRTTTLSRQRELPLAASSPLLCCTPSCAACGWLRKSLQGARVDCTRHQQCVCGRAARRVGGGVLRAPPPLQASDCCGMIRVRVVAALACARAVCVCVVCVCVQMRWEKPACRVIFIPQGPCVCVWVIDSGFLLRALASSAHKGGKVWLWHLLLCTRLLSHVLSSRFQTVAHPPHLNPTVEPITLTHSFTTFA
jgi:hypothetical protein